MVLLVLVALLCVALPILIGREARRRGAGAIGTPRRWAAALSTRFTPAAGAAVVLVGGTLVVLAVGVAFGFLVKALQPALDEPTFRFVHGHVTHGAFTTLNEKLTVLGNNSTVQLVVLVAAIVLGAVYGKRWWLPVVAIVGAYYLERYVQKALGAIVDRGHPPTTLGTYPSGGVARIYVVYGVVIVLVMLALPRLSRAWRAGLWTGLSTAAAIEAFTRVYLSLHWFTDALGGLLVGALLLLVCDTALHLATRPTGRYDAARLSRPAARRR